MKDGAEDRALVNFLVAFLSDRESGGVHPLGDYLARFPGHEEAVARRYVEMLDAEKDASTDEDRIGPYRLVEEIGRGGQGEVWLAEHEILPRRVALKILHPGQLADDARSRFQREAAVASRLDHPGLCAVYETGRHHGRDWIAMRHIEGVSLSARLRGDRAPLTHAEAAELTEAIARALHVAHEAGVVHRDVKPANVLIGTDGAPVVLDFGLARDDTAAATLTQSGSVFGTPDWMSPEQVRSSRNLDRRTDVWATGCILYECLTGERPFSAPTVDAVLQRIRTDEPRPLHELARGVPHDLEIIVSTALEKDLSRRYQSAHDLAEDLRRFRAREPILARPAGVGLRITRYVERHPRRVAVMVGALLAALSIGWFAREADVARAGMLRTDDYRRALEMLDEERNLLWPVGPGLVARSRAWLDEADERLARQDGYVEDLERLDEGDRTLDETLNELLNRLDRLARRRALIEDRLRRAGSLARRSIEDHRDAWRRCADSIAASAQYGGLVLSPQLGLVPLGVNARGYFEFWHVESGSRPPFDAAVGAHLEATSGIVLVLIPGGTVRIGASDHEGALAGTNANEPARTAELAPYFLAKFETTQGQWMLTMSAEAPSATRAGDATHGAADVGWTNPVESVSGRAVMTMLARLALELPTEAQWEAGCRAGARSPWSWGSDRTCSTDHANLYGEEMLLPHMAPRPTEARDRHQRHAAVGSYATNPYGLADMHGNVFEWCRDRYAPRPMALRPGDGLADDGAGDAARLVIKGGSFLRTAVYGRAALRAPFGGEVAEIDLVFRAARAVDSSSDGPSKKKADSMSQFR